MALGRENGPDQVRKKDTKEELARSMLSLDPAQQEGIMVA